MNLKSDASDTNVNDSGGYRSGNSSQVYENSKVIAENKEKINGLDGRVTSNSSQIEQLRNKNEVGLSDLSKKIDLMIDKNDKQYQNLTKESQNNFRELRNLIAQSSKDNSVELREFTKEINRLDEKQSERLEKLRTEIKGDLSSIGTKCDNVQQGNWQLKAVIYAIIAFLGVGAGMGISMLFKLPL